MDSKEKHTNESVNADIIEKFYESRSTKPQT